MFLTTQEEIDAGCGKIRHQPEMDAPGYLEGDSYEAISGKPGEHGRPDAPMPIIVAEALKGVHDTEIPLNVYDLGLIYDINVADNGDTVVLMTLTTPNSPAADTLPKDIADCVAGVPGVGRVGVKLTFDVPWNPDMMSEIADVELGLDR